MDSKGKEVGPVGQIQDQGKSLQEAGEGDKVAISVQGPTLGRQVRENDVLYTLPRSHEVRLVRSKYMSALTPAEAAALDEIVRIKSETDPLFGF